MGTPYKSASLYVCVWTQRKEVLMDIFADFYYYKSHCNKEGPDVGQREHTSSYKMKKFWGSNV